MIRSGALKIQRACPGGADIDRKRSFCHTCDKAVHDLSTQTQAEVERLLAAHAGRELCVSYRVDARGEPVFKAEPAPRCVPPIVMALALAACTPWGLDEPPTAIPGQGGECVMVEEGVWECVDETLPEEPPIEAEVEEGSSCDGPQVEDEISITMGGIAVSEEVGTPAPPEGHEVELVDGEEVQGPVVRVDFEIDPDDRMRRTLGMIIPAETIGGRLHYTPSVDLWKDWKKRRDARVAQRKAQRKKRRLAKKD